MEEWIKKCGVYVYIQWNIIQPLKERSCHLPKLDKPRGHYTK
jgi:hypothetical protein